MRTFAYTSHDADEATTDFCPHCDRLEACYGNGLRARQSNGRGSRNRVGPIVRDKAFAIHAALMTLLLGASAWAHPQSGAAAAAGQSLAIVPAAWTPKELGFTYQTGFTTKYSCDGLRDRMRKLLIKLGAREDLQVDILGCVQQGPDLLPGVRVKMSVLEPAREWVIGRTVPAQWKHVDLLADRDAVSASADCELIRQIKEQVLPLFATRNVDYSARCEKNHLVVGGTRLTADVLVPDQSVRVTGIAR